MDNKRQYSSFLSTFTVNIIFVMLIIVGAAMIPLLSLQLNPSRYLPTVYISWNWQDTPVRVVEQEVTTVLEGILSTVTGVKKISSSTYNEYGTIAIEFDKDVDIRAKRFEVASLIRESRSKLPDEVTYPTISMNSSTNQNSAFILSFQINGNANTSYIYTLADETIKPAISLIEGIYAVSIYGATPQEWEVLYDQQKMSAMGLDASSISKAIDNYLAEEELGGASEIASDGSVKRTYLTLIGNLSETFRWEEVPVASVAGRIIHLTDVAKITCTEKKATSFFRINGLNTINMNVSAEKNVNTVKVAAKVKEEMERLKKNLPPGYSIRTSYDNTTYIKEEISKNIYRTILSVVLLLLFVLLISREFKYLFIITISLVANVFIAFIFYYIFKLEIHLYSLAGITVSFGLIINNTIVITDHLRYHKDKKVGLSLLAATLTTIGALVVIFFLDEASKVNLTDFAAVVIINLLVSLAVALLFIPALLEKIKLKPKYNALIIRRKRRVVRFSHFYLKSIGFILQHKVLLIIFAILLFGLPVFYLPDTLPKERKRDFKEESHTRFEKLYNKTLGNSKYVQDIKPLVNKCLGGTFRLFSEKIKNSRFYYSGGSDEQPRTKINVNIGLSEEGLTIDDINTTCMGLENMLAQYNEIDMFTTSINGSEDASIDITFKPEYDYSIFPYILKFRIEDYMNGIGSYHASVYGVGKGFSNQVSSDYIRGSYSIVLRGYNYDQLSSYAEALKERLIVSGKQRIKEVYILGGNNNNYWNTKKSYRNRIEMDKYYLSENNSDVSNAFSEAQRYSRTASSLPVYINGASTPLKLKAAQSDEYDYWSFINAPLETNSGSFVKIKDFSTVSHEITNSMIGREDQQYVINVTYDFIGNYELGKIIQERNLDETNAMLPLGYTAEISGYSWSWDQKKANYYLIFLVITIIYFICAILLESFKQPLTVVSLIPFSFIGLFATFAVFKINADEGAFAALILLCGIVVNATLYILNDYNSIRRRKPLLPERVAYIKAFNGKIIPIILTKLSTIVGLIPFLLTGKDERFWFALAAGTIGGLFFSFIGLFVYQPMMLKGEARGTEHVKWRKKLFINRWTKTIKL